MNKQCGTLSIKIYLPQIMYTFELMMSFGNDSFSARQKTLEIMSEYITWLHYELILI